VKLLVLTAGIVALATPLASSARIATRGATSAHIVFVAARDGDRDVYAIEPSGSGLRALTRNRVPETAMISPDGRRLVVRRPCGSRTELVSIRLRARRTQLLVRGTNVELGQFSPDGRWFAYTRGPNVGIVAIDGRGGRLVTSRGVYEVIDWSPDSSRLLLRGGAAEADENLLVVARAGTSRRLFAQDVKDASWGPHWIAVVRDVGEHEELDAWDPVADAPRFPLDRAERIRLAGWAEAPVGAELAAISAAAGRETALFWNIESSRAEPVAVAAHISEAVWSPSGDALAITIPAAGGNGETIDVSTPFPHEQLGLLAGRAGFGIDSLAWSPDGQEIAYTSGSTLYVARRDGTRRRTLTGRGDPKLVGWAVGDVR
jgi:dipeptidyl aminopeptidase/acylaminoacyl peptidase